jgi:putative Holliday junction resolvase
VDRRYLGIDYGEKRIGLARADEDLKVARPWRVIEKDHLPPAEIVRGIIQQEGITDLVVGLPRSLDGNDTDQTRVVRQFAAELERLGLPVFLQDEAVTSQSTDDAAATQILHDYLENH